MSGFGTPHAPNFANRGPNVIACAVVLLVAPSITVFIRIWSRYVATRARFWWDDFMLLVTLLFSHLYLATNIWGVTLGLGKHIWMIPLKNTKPTLLNEHLGIIWYTMAINLMKLSALTLYARLFRVAGSTKWWFWGLSGIIIIGTIAGIVVPWTNCHPLAKTLNPFLEGTCVSRTSFYLAVGVVNFLLDLIVLLVPMPFVWRLNLRLRKKILVSFVFLLGYCSAILSLTRLIIIAKNPLILSAAPGQDPSWDTIPLLYVSMLEAPFALIALCGPPINQFIQRARNFGWRALLSTKEYPTPLHQGSGNSGRTPKFGSDNSGFEKSSRKNSSRDMPASKNYYKLEASSLKNKKSEELSLRNKTSEDASLRHAKRSGEGREDVEMGVIGAPRREFV